MVNELRETTKQYQKNWPLKLLHDRSLNVSQWTVQRPLKRMGYKSILPYGTPILTQEQKHVRVQWAIQHKDDDWSRTIYLLMQLATSCFAILFVDDHEIQVLTSNEFPKTNRR